MSKRAMGRVGLALSCAALAALAGCLDVTEEIRVNGDASGRLYVDLAVNEKVASLASLAGDKALIPFNEADLRAALEYSDNIESFTVTTRQDNGMAHTVLDAVVKDFTRPLPKLATGGSDGNPASEAIVPFTIKRLENKNLRFVHDLSTAAAGKGGEGAGLLAGLAFKDRFLTVRLFGNIVSTNGILAEDKHSVEWRIPLSQIIAGTTVIKQLEAEIAPPALSGLTTVVIVGMVVAALGIGSIVLFRRRFL